MRILNNLNVYGNITANSPVYSTGGYYILVRNNTTGVFESVLSSTFALSSRNIIAGNGLIGGGNLTADRTLTLGTPSSVTLSSTNSVSSTSHTHTFAPGGTTSQYIRGDGSLATFPSIPAVSNWNQVLTAGNDAGGISAINTGGAGGRWTEMSPLGFYFNETTTGTGYAGGLHLRTNDGVTTRAGFGFYNSYAYIGWGALPYSTNRIVAINDNGVLITPGGGMAVPTTMFQVLGETSTGLSGKFDNEFHSANSAGIRISGESSTGTKGYSDYIVNSQSGIAGFGFGTSSVNLPIGSAGTKNLGLWVNVNNDGFSGRHFTVANTLFIPTLASSPAKMLTVGAAGIVAAEVIPTGTVTSVGMTIGGAALNVTPVTITSSGTFALTWAGTAAQYVNGLGNLVTFPTIPAGTVTSITIGNGLTGSSPITSTGTITLGTPESVTLSSTNAVAASSHTHAFAPGGTTSQYIRGDGSLATFPTIPAGTVTSITAGNGMNFATITSSGAVTLGTPSDVTLGSTNSVTATSHTHNFNPGGTAAQYITGAGTLATFPTLPTKYLTTDITEGTEVTLTTGADLNALGNFSGTGYVTGATNGPGSSTAFVHNISYSSGASGYQTFFNQTSEDNIYWRVKTGGSFGSWFQFASREHVSGTYVPLTRQVIAGNGMTDGGALTSNVTLTMGTPSNITLSSTNSVTATSHTHNFAPGGTAAQYIRGDGSLATFPTITDTVTRLRGTAAGTFVSGDITLLAGVNVIISQSGNDITIASTNTTYTGSTSITLSGTSFLRAALTGDVTAASNSNTTTIADNAVTNAKAADMAGNTMKGRLSSTGDPQDLTVVQVRDMLNITDGFQDNGYQYGLPVDLYNGIETGGGFAANIVRISSSYTVTPKDYTIMLYGNTAYNLNLPNAVDFMNRIIEIAVQFKANDGTVFVNLSQPIQFYNNDGITIGAKNTITALDRKSAGGIGNIKIQSDGNAWWWIN